MFVQGNPKVAIVALSFLVVASCRSEREAPVADSYQNLRAISVAYRRATDENNTPPAKSEDLTPFLKDMGDPEKFLVSSNDNEPYVIHWNVDYRQLPSQPSKHPVLAYEKTGKNGIRYVLRMRDIEKMTNEEFMQLSFPAGYSPPN